MTIANKEGLIGITFLHKKKLPEDSFIRYETY